MPLLPHPEKLFWITGLEIVSLLFYPFYVAVNSFWLMLSPSLSPEDLAIYMLAI